MTSFLYPFLDDTPPPTERMLTELSDAAAVGWATSTALLDTTIAANGPGIEWVAQLLVATAQEGRGLFLCGNGGSATDAARMLRVLPQWVRARTLTDSAVVTAIANDLGATNMFSRQILAAVRPGDVVVLFTTSGSSANIVAAAEVAGAAGAAVVALAGYGGGALITHPAVLVCLTVESTSTHRIQEAQGGLVDAVVARVNEIRNTSP